MAKEDKKSGFMETRLGRLVAKVPLEAGFAFIFVILVLLLTQIAFFRNLELGGYDLRMQLKSKIDAHPGVSVLVVDDESINKFGQWPWRRNIHAQALDILKELGSRQVVFDVEFTEASSKKVSKAGATRFKGIISSRLDALRNDIAALRGNIRSGRVKNVVPVLGEFEKAITARKKDILMNISQLGQNDDQLFAMAITRHGSVTVPIRGSQDTNLVENVFHEYVLNNYGYRANGADFGSGVVVDKRLVIPSNPLHRAPLGLAFVNVDTDSDGVRRRVALFRGYKKRLFPQLVIPALLSMLQITKKDVAVYPGSKVVFKNALLPGSKTRKDISVPIDDKGQMLINWAGVWKKQFAKFSYAELFAYVDAKQAMCQKFAQLDSAIFQGALQPQYKRLEQIVAILKSGKPLSQKVLAEKAGLEKYILATGTNELAVLAKTVLQFKQALKTAKGSEKQKIEGQYKVLKVSLENVKKDYSIYKTLKQRVADIVKNGVVIIGHATSNTTDLGHTPFEVDIPQVFVHPNVLNTILQGQFIHEAPKGINILVMFLVPFIFSMVTIKLRPSRIVILGLAVFAAYFMFNFFLFAVLGYWIDLVNVQIAFFLTFLSVTVLHYLRGDREKKFITAAFSHYLSPDVIDVLVQDPKSLKLGGERKVLTAFFSDVQGFSSISESMSPEALVDLLNEYLTDMTDIVMQQKGTVDKFEGDAIIAFYGAPVPFEDHALRACLAAIHMQTRIDQMRPLWKEKYGHELFVRMGINTGQMVVGNMGSKTRFDYTMMGDSVNLAARLEGVNKYYNTYSMISGDTYQYVKDEIAVREIDILRVVGKDEPVTVYELLAEKKYLDEQIAEKIQAFEKALAVYREKDWKQARTLFKEVLKLDKNDGPSQTYVERCSKFIKTPPPANWDGVYTLRGK